MRTKHWFYTIPLRLRSLFRRARVEQELDEELRYHLVRQTEENIAKGMTPEEARYTALRAMGGVERRKEECRDMRRVRLIEDLAQDLRYGLRTLRKSPGFTAAAVLSLALGIGANTAIFSLVDPIMLRLLPVNKPEQLVVLKSVDEHGEHDDYFTYSMFKHLRARAPVFSGVFAGGFVETVDSELDGQSEKLRLSLVSGEYFHVLGVKAVVGRTLTTADDQTPGAHPVAVLSYRFWQRRFAGDVSVIGKAIKLKTQPFVIVGVTSPEFFGDGVGAAPDLWAPLVMMNFVLQGRSGHNSIDDVGLRIMARLRSDIREEQAQAALDIFWGQIQSEPNGPEKGELENIILSSGSQGFTGFRAWISQPLRILMAAACLVLLIACANVANLLLARAARRAPEVAIRLTIGAGRLRLVRQFLTESALLAAAGAVLGLLFAWWGRRVLLALMAEYHSDLTIDSVGAIPNARALGFTLATSLLATLLFGLAPALIATRLDLNTALKARTRRRSRISLSRALVIAQVALSLLMLTGAGLLVQTLYNLRARDFGFAAEHIIQGSIFAEDAGYPKDQLPGLYGQILERMNSTPGVRSATMASAGFLNYDFTRGCCIDVEGYTHHPDEDRRIEYKGVRPGYFQTIGLPLLLGRDFTPEDIGREPYINSKVAIINETMARYYFGTANPLGRRFGWGGHPDNGRYKYNTEIIGVVKDSIYINLRDKARAIYFPTQSGNLLVARVSGQAAPLVATIRREVLAIDKNLVIGDIYTLPQMVDEYLFLERLLAKLSSFFAMLALLLACVGLYGVMSYDVARRKHEIGIRIALGAQRRDVVSLVMRETIILVAIGLIIGLSAAIAFTRLMTGMLYGLAPSDPLTIALAGLLLLAVAALAGYLPARRASRVDPMAALRHE